jgi:diguanylate cyclase (GGDEF)-like protein
MIMTELELNYSNIINLDSDSGINIIWDPSEAKLIVDEKIVDIIYEFDIENYELEQLLKYINKDDKENVLNFFTQDLEKTYENREQIQQVHKYKSCEGNVEFIIIGRIIKNNFKYYLIGTIYYSKDKNNWFNDVNSFMECWKESVLNNRISSIIQADRITSLPNRYLFKDIVSGILEKSIENNTRTAMIVVNLDNFKYVNDSFGHDFGDLLLKEVSYNLLAAIDGEILMSRYSGDTFLIFKSNIVDIQEVLELCDVIAKSLENPNVVQEKKIYLTASIGVSLSPDHGIDYNTLLKNADAAMYEAKKNGKNECNFFDHNISIELNRIYSLQKGLRTALQNNEFYVMFQPKVALDDSKVNGFEALARWESAEFGLVSPVEFIPIAENSKMIIPIGSFVLEEVFKKIKYLLNEGNDNFKIAVNLSEMQLREDVVVSEFKDLIKKYRINPKYIEVEITESVLMKSFNKNVEILEEIRKLGVSIALDDFGTGYSSLNYLTKLPIDVLKIDRSFVIDLMDNPKSKCIVENIINLSHQLGIEVVAEGVEDKGQVEYLRAILCDVVQGYYFSKPRMFNQIINIIGKEIS